MSCDLPRIPRIRTFKRLTPKEKSLKRTPKSTLTLGKLQTAPIKNKNPQARKPRHKSSFSSLNLVKLKSSLSKTKLTEESLQEDIENSWKYYCVPSFHKQLFKQQLSQLSKSDAQHEIMKEILMLNRGKAPVLKCTNSIAEREETLTQLKQIAEELEEKHTYQSIKVLQLEAAQKIKELRLKSIEVVESIKEWKEQIGDSVFFWEETNYLNKMKEDYSFLLISKVSQIILFPSNCDTFFVPGKNLKDPERISVVLPLNLASRAKEAASYLGANRVLEETQKTPLPEIAEDSTPELKKIPTAASQDSSFEDLELEDLDTIGRQIVNSLFEELNNQISEETFKESYNEMISAALVLFSSSVLDKYISETLKQKIPEITYAALQEVKDSEYFDFQEQVCESLISIELCEISELCALEVLAEEITSGYCKGISLNRIVEESISEEHEWNSKILELIFFDIIEELISGEWLEILCEDELSYSRLDEMWNVLPAYIKKDMFVSGKNGLVDRVAEEVYFNWLNEVVSEVWVDRIVRFTVGAPEEELDLDFVMSITSQESSKKKKTLLPYRPNN